MNTALAFRFEQYLQVHALSLATIRNYLADLRAFARWHAPHSSFSQSVSHTDFTDYREHLCTETNHSPATVNRRLQALRLFGRFLYETGNAEENPARDIELLRHTNGNGHAPRTLNVDEIKRLSHAIRAGRPSLIQRDFAIMQMLLNAGLRIHEIAELTMNNLARSHRGMSAQIQANGNGARTVPLNATAAHALRDYLGVRPAIPGIEQVFVSQRGQPLSVRSVQRLIDTYARAAGLDGVCAQMLRHTCAKNLLARTRNAKQVAKILGHHNIKTLDRYTK